MIATNRPFRDAQQDIKPGQTSREDVHRILGEPFGGNVVWPASDEGNVEVYRAVGSSIGLISIIPIPTGDIAHYALITYDASGRVSATDWNYNTYNTSPWNGVKLYAGDYGYHTGTRTIFYSKDGGGDADRWWVTYLDDRGYYETWGWQQINPKGNYRRKLVWAELCRAAEMGHPAALAELGNYFWDGRDDPDEGCKGSWDEIKICIERRKKERRYAPVYHRIWDEFDKDNVKACLWYSMANDKALPAWCDKELTKNERIRVEHLLKDWQSSWLRMCEY